MYVCMYVTHPSEVEQPRACKKKTPGEAGGPVGGRGATSGEGGGKERGPVGGQRPPAGKGASEGRGRGGQLASGTPASAPRGKRGLARAAPSPGQARAGVLLATTARRCRLGCP